MPSLTCIYISMISHIFSREYAPLGENIGLQIPERWKKQNSGAPFPLSFIPNELKGALSKLLVL